MKILSKALANCVEKYLPFLISSSQTVYVESRFISDGGRLFSHTLQVADFLKLNALVVTEDIQKAFDSINHLFFNNCIKKKLALVKHLLSGYKFY